MGQNSDLEGGRLRLRPGHQQPPAVWRASPAPRGGPSHCGRRSPGCASSSRSTACVGSAAPSSPPQTQRREHPASRQTDDRPEPGTRFIFIFYNCGFILVPVCLRR